MALTIERLRYYDGEFLRSFDWTAEQNYHLEMRRRLHMAMNPWGIIEGLDITTDTEGTVKTFSISPGVAIDAFGREIFIFNPYQLDDSLITNNLITAPNDYQLVLRYKVAAGTPPSAGYGQCNGSNQFTRFQESFDVLLWPIAQNLPAPEPAPTDTLSENAKQDGWVVPIGKVTVALGPDGKTLIIANAVEVNRTYIGVRAQRIVSPEDATALFDITAPQTPNNPPASVEIDSDLYVPQSIVVGQNFAMAKINGTPPKNVGSVKIAGDLVLQGSIFVLDPTALTPTWTSLQNFISSQQSALASLMPQVVMKTTTVEIPLNSSSNVTSSTSSPNISETTTFLPGKFTVQVSASINGVIWRDKDTVDKVRAPMVGGDTDSQYQITANPSVTSTGVDLNFTWTIAPVKAVGPMGTFVSAIKTLLVSYIVMFIPKP